MHVLHKNPLCCHGYQCHYLESQQISVPSSKVEAAWQELDMYQQMTEREKREANHGVTGGHHDQSKQMLIHSHNSTSNQTPPTSRPLPVPAKPVATLLSMWTAKQHHKASSNHVEFAGRRNFGERAELYLFMKNSGR